MRLIRKDLSGEKHPCASQSTRTVTWLIIHIDKMKLLPFVSGSKPWRNWGHTDLAHFYEQSMKNMTMLKINTPTYKSNVISRVTCT